MRFTSALFPLCAALATLTACTTTKLPPAPVAATTQPYRNGAVACDHPIASRAGLDMLLIGGNAVDAAVAASFCLSVVRPYSCGIGGGGFMLIHDPGDDLHPPRSIALNYRETAPRAVGPDYYVNLTDAGDHPSRFGVHAVGVPGTVRGLLHALDHYGTLDRATVLAPAIRAAEFGFAADASFIAAIDTLREVRDQQPLARDTSDYFWNTVCRGGAVQAGDRLHNPEQAQALRLIAEHGEHAFYHGPIAEAIAAVMAQRDGPITTDDLAAYSMRLQPPLRGSFQGRDVLTMPLPSSGGIAQLQVLAILQRRLGDVLSTDISRRDPTDPAYVHLLTEAFKHAFADRAAHLADADFVDVPVQRLLDAAYLDARAESIDMQHTRDASRYGSTAPLPADAGTSHLSVIDAHGMAVACTETINTVFGSCVEVPGYGFMLNNEMDDFTTVPGQANAYGLTQSDRNLPEPGKRPLSSMSPTIVLRDGNVELIAGASGGPRIITGTLQAMLNAMLFDMHPDAAVSAPRLHHQWMPDILQFEDQWSDAAVINAMQQRGHDVGRRDGVGVVQFIRVSPDGIRAASDPRKGGRPAGY